MNDETGILTLGHLRDLLPLAVVLGTLFAAGLVLDIHLLLRFRRPSSEWRRRVECLRNRPWTWCEALSLGMVVMLLNLVALLVVRAMPRDGGAEYHSIALYLFLQTAWIPVSLLILLGYYLRRRQVCWQDAFGSAEGSFLQNAGKAAASLLAILPPMCAIACLSHAILKGLRLPLQSQFVVEFLTDPTQPYWLRGYICLAAVLIAPVVEELCFRGILLPALAKLSSGTMAIVAVSIIFAGFHLNLLSFAPLFLLSVGFSLAYAYSNSITTSILMHSFFNGFSIAVLLVVSHMLGPC